MKYTRILLSTLIMTLQLSADEIEFKNGLTMEGIVVKETKTHIELDIGGGTTTIAKSKINKITRSKTSEKSDLRAKWEKKNFLHKKNVPKGLEKIATSYRSLVSQRESAIKSQQIINFEDGTVNYLQKEIMTLIARQVTLTRQMNEITPENVRRKLNGMISRQNTLAANLTIKVTKVQDLIKNNRQPSEKYITQMEKEKKTVEDLTASINKLVSPEKRDQYNKVHSNLKNIQNDVTEKKLRINKSDPIRAAALDQISDYIFAFPKFHLEFATVFKTYQKKERDEKTNYFLNTIADSMNHHRLEISKISIKSKSTGNATIVSVVINDKARGNFILDTGATDVTMSEAFAKKAGIALSGLKTVEAGLADGRVASGKTVILSSVKLQSAKAEHIHAIIFPTSPSSNADGLLGMSFLRHFVLSLEGGPGNLVLNKFTPK